MSPGVNVVRGECHQGLLSPGVIVTRGDWSGVIVAGVIVPGVNVAKPRGTIQFLKIMTAFWKILITKEKGELELFKDKLRGEISDPQDIKLKILLKIGDMAEKMTASGKKRTRQLSKDTGTALAHLCRGLVDMTRTLLSQDS